MLRACQKYYRTGIEMYLLENVVRKIEDAMTGGEFRISDFKSDISGPAAVYDREWVDVAGQLMPKKRLTDLEDAIEAGRIDSIETFSAQTKSIHNLLPGR